MKDEKFYTLPEEIANVVTHAIGLALSIAGMVWIIVRTTRLGDPWAIVGGIVFGTTLATLYLASTLYHAVPCPRPKRIMRLFDHCAIYLLIAGTYTPFLLVSMRGPVGWTFFGILWGIACVGCAFKALFMGKWSRLSVGLYLAMGWFILIGIKPAIAYIPMGALLFMLVGGLAYTVGVLFYLSDRLPFNHAIWHCFVMAGSALHFFAILIYVLRPPVV